MECSSDRKNMKRLFKSMSYSLETVHCSSGSVYCSLGSMDFSLGSMDYSLGSMDYSSVHYFVLLVFVNFRCPRWNIYILGFGLKALFL